MSMSIAIMITMILPALRRLVRHAVRVAAVLLCGVFAAALPLRAGVGQLHLGPAQPRVLIVYDSWHQLPNPRKSDIDAPDSSCSDALQLEQLLGHFPFAANLVRLTEYQPGMLAGYTQVFFIGNVKQAVLPAPFLRDVRHYQGSLYWINYGIGQLDSRLLKRVGIAFQRLESEPGYTKVHYHGIELLKGDPTTNIIQVTAPARCTVVAETFADNRAGIPYIVHSGSFWYIADSPFSYVGDRDRYFAFADTLYDFFGVKPPQRKRALIRVEDVNVTDDPRALREDADRLYALHVPFVISTIPHYKNPMAKEPHERDIPMDSDLAPGFISTLHYMTRHGGSIVMHGDTHQYNKGITADDFEFWNGSDEHNPVIPGDSVPLVEGKLQDGLNRLFTAQLYPIAWETPHYAASILDYSVFARHFSTALEQRVLLNRPEFSQYFPFVIQRDIYGQQIFPENLGYVELQEDEDHHEDVKAEEEEVDTILRNARDLGVLRDVTVGAFIHSFVKPALVTRLAQGLQREGYAFIDLRQENNTVQFDDMLTGTGTVHGQVQLHGEYLQEFYLDPQGNIQQESCSKETISGTVKRELTVPAGWIYVCHGRRDRPLSWLAQTKKDLIHDLAGLPGHFTGGTVTSANEPARIALLTADHLSGAATFDQASFFQAFTAMGLAPDPLPAAPVTVKMLEPYNVLVVPQGSALALSPTQVTFIAGEVNRGLNILIDGASPLAKALGVEFSPTTFMVNEVCDTQSGQSLQWTPTPVPICSFPPGANVLYQDMEDERPMAAWYTLNRGHCLAFATLFDPSTGLGYARYPTLPTAFFTAFPVIPAFTSRDLELFFDSAYLPDNVSIEKRVQKWKQWGVRAIHADCWEMYTDPRTHERFPFDYARLIKNCHANGIAVYAWFELPLVTKDFFEAHPEWQEKTAAGTSSRGSWRADYAMALEIPACRQAVLQFVSDRLRRYDWDGVNLSELCFESVKGPEIRRNSPPCTRMCAPRSKHAAGSIRRSCVMMAVITGKPIRTIGNGSSRAVNKLAANSEFWKTHPDDWQPFCAFRTAMYHENVKSLDEPTRFVAQHPEEYAMLKAGCEFAPTELCAHGPHDWKTHPADWHQFLSAVDKLAANSEFWKTHPADWQPFCAFRTMMYHEKVESLADPTQFVAKHPEEYAMLKAGCGFAPAELCYTGRHYWKTHPTDWQQFCAYRAELLHDIYRDTLRELQHFQYGDPRMERRALVVTAYDTINNPEIRRNTGLDICDLIGMMSRTGHVLRKLQGERFDFILNVEDPQSRWNDRPDRYLALGKQYRELLPDPNKLALDINIVDLAPKKDVHRPFFATNTPLGLETLEMLHSARSVTQRVIIYCESDLSPLDTGDVAVPPFCMLGCAVGVCRELERMRGRL